MNIWSSGRVICFSHEFLGNSQSMDFSSYFRKFISQICLGTWCRIELVDSASSCPCFERLCCPCTVPTLMRVYLWLIRTYLLCFCFFLFTYCIVHKVSMCRAWTFWSSECSFVSLRMICKTTIWCNQILIVKQQWRAVILTSRMIFLCGIFLVHQCS